MYDRIQGLRWLIQSSVVIFAGSLTGQLIGLSATILLSRSLGLETFGQFTIIMSVVNLTAGILTSPFSRSQARFAARFLGEGNAESLMGTLYFGLLATLVCSLALAGLLALSSEWISMSYLKDPSLEQVLLMAVLVIPCISLTGSVLQSLRGLGYATDRVLVESLCRPILRGLSYLLLFASLSLPIAIYLEVGIMYFLLAVALSLLFFRSRLFHNYRPRFNFKEYREFTWPLIPASVASQLTYQLPLLSLGWFNMMEQAALYAVSLRIAAFGRTLVMTLNSNFAPMISNYQGGGRMDELKVLFKKVSRILLIVTSAWFATCIVYGSYIIDLFGAEFDSAYAVLVVLAALTVPIGVFGPVTNVITMTGYSKVTMASSLINLAFATLLTLLLVPRYGAIGAAIMVVTSAFFFQFYQAICLYRLHQIIGITARGVYFAFALILFSLAVAQLRTSYLVVYDVYQQLSTMTIIFLIGVCMLLLIFTSRNERHFIYYHALNVISKKGQGKQCS